MIFSFHGSTGIAATCFDAFGNCWNKLIPSALFNVEVAANKMGYTFLIFAMKNKLISNSLNHQNMLFINSYQYNKAVTQLL